MAETQKETSSVGQPKKKNSFLDLDFGKDDFLSSWKTMSITKDDTMDLDFGPISKGKKKAFNFDKSDMDFNLDGDFGKLPSFNLDIPDIDISSPVKRDGKRKERSIEESALGKAKGKADCFDFAFDFQDLDGFNFQSRSKKEDVIVKGDNDKENSSNKMLSKTSSNCLAEDVDEHQYEYRNLPLSGSPTTSKFDLQDVAGCSHDMSNGNSPSKSAKNEAVDPNPTAAIVESASHKTITLVDKTASASNQGLDFQPDKSMSPESHAQEACSANENLQDKSVHSVFQNESSQDTVSEVQEEVSFGDAKVCNLEQSVNKEVIVASGSNYKISGWSGVSEHDIAVTEKDKAGSQVEIDTDSLVANKEGAEPVRTGRPIEKFLPADSLTESVHKSQVNVKNKDLLELSSTINSRTTADNLKAEKEREAVTRSKYFKQTNKTELRFQNASYQTLCSSSDRLIGARQICPQDGSQKCSFIEPKINTKLAGISLSYSDSKVGQEDSQTETWESRRGFKTNRSLDEEMKKGKPVVLTGGEKNVKSLDSVSSYINTSSMSGQTIKSTSQNCSNTASLAKNMVSSQNRKSSAAAEDKLSSVKTIKQMPTLSGLTTSRTSGENLDSSRSQSQKDTVQSVDVQQSRILAGRTPSKTVEVIEPKKQTPPGLCLKRKIDEACSADLISKPSKRPSDSLSNKNSAETSGKMVDIKACRTDFVLKPSKLPSGSTSNRNSAETSEKNVEEKACDNEKVADRKSMNACKNQSNPNLDFPNQLYMNDLEAPSIDYESNIEMAEACSKGLEDICNLLSKKHEEAKELLVRAVVTSNRLLMLDHPIYEEKIRMIQKFAAQLTLREIHTQT